MLPNDSSHILWLLIPVILLIRYPFTLGGFACLSNPCIHGVCLDDLNTSYSCYCIDGYTGVQCQTNWNECWSNPCQNGGICVDGIAAFNCTCPPGFVGEFCEEDLDECDSNPCLNNGSCIDGTNGYTCKCLLGYSGTHCEIDVAVCNSTNETRCENGGVCVEGPGYSFSCKCQPGWGGILCGTEINECISAPCQNGAVCIDLHADYACACLIGYTGKNCEEEILHCKDDPCENEALCLTEEGHPVCYCVPDFHGDRCQYQYDECQLGPRCLNGGTCIDGVDSFTCSCPPSLTGVLCECLIINDKQLDCTYIATTSPLTSTTESLKTISYSTTKSDDFTTVPNISTVFIDNTTSSIITLSTTEMSTSVILSTTASTETTQLISTVSINTTTIEEVIITETLPSESTKEILTSTDVTTVSLFQNETITPTLEYSPTTEYIPYTLTESPKTSSTIESFTSTEFFNYSTLSVEQTEPPTTSLFTTSVHATDSTEMSSLVTPFLTEEPSTLFSSPETESIFPETSSFIIEITTSSRENTTKSISTDCSKPEHVCQNGGTCIFGSKGYECICPYDTEGPLCEIVLDIRNAAFGGNSYLTHHLTNMSGIEVEFTTKTLSPNGLIFYSDRDTTYMALYIENGYLKFIFSCGYQTMLLAELNNPINDGFNMIIKARLQFSKDFKYCNASVMVNNTLSMSGNQIAVINKLIKPTSVLHLGGLPQEKLKEYLPTSGFMGCITDLKIFGKKIDIFKDAEDGFKVSECSSLACLSNPCYNEGTCIENKENWYCQCKNGFLGRLCEISICDNNPCLFGATCMPFTGSGYICLCPFGKHGHFCEYDLEITEPNFSSTVRGLSSYAAYPVPIGGISSNMELKFKFVPSTMDQIAILMFIGQTGLHDALSDHIAVSFVKGYIMLTWNLGSGPRRIFTSRPVIEGKSSYMLRLGRFGRRAWLSVDNLGNITGRSPGTQTQLDVAPILYLGGHDSPNFSILPHDLPLHSGFLGCIYDVQLKSGDLVIPLQTSRQVVGRSVGQCETSECHEMLCQNRGACIHHGATFVCLCQDGWFGPLCSSKSNPCTYKQNQCSKESVCVPLLTGYECDCPLEKTGKYCDKDEKLSDVSLSGRRSYIALKPINAEVSKFNIELQLRTLSDRGLVLFIGHKKNSFISLSLHSGLLELRILPAKRRLSNSEAFSIRSNKLLAMGGWYTVRFGKYGNQLYLYVDHIVNTGILRSSDVIAISREVIYLGGLPDMSELPATATTALPTPFKGCIRKLMINTQHISLTSEFIERARNIQDCDGTPCGGDACENGGTCWLDSELKPHCSCVEPYIGERCESIPSCKERPCQHQGRCIDAKCACVVGYTGAFCESAIMVRLPEFAGNSHLILKGRSSMDKKRGLGSMSLQSLHLNFTTADTNGLILWSSKANTFIGIGIEKGYLKIVYSLYNTNKTVVEVPPVRSVADGLWHSLEITIKSTYLKIHLDKRILQTQMLSDNEKLNSTIVTDGIFYLGGLPPGDSHTEKTYGFFTQPFSGCIAEVGFNNENLVTDFTTYEGENIGVCTIF